LAPAWNPSGTFRQMMEVVDGELRSGKLGRVVHVKIYNLLLSICI
jgi:hypothetical protein